MMELDELKQKWAEHDRKLEVNIRLTRQLLSATKMNRARSALQRLAFSWHWSRCPLRGSNDAPVHSLRP